MSEIASPIDSPIIVLGVERSGTSAVAAMIYRWGAFPGESDKLHEANEHAPKGYWEYLPLWEFLAELGEFSSGGTWWSTDFQERMEGKVSDSAYRRKALELLNEMRQEDRPWYWKDPALSHFLPFRKRLWEDPVYIITVRHPLDTAVSWQRFIMPTKLEGNVSFVPMNLLRWQHMMMQILEHTGSARRIFIAYEDVLREPRAPALRLDAFLNSRLGNRVSRIDAMVDAVYPDLCHHHCDTPFQSVREATSEQKALYAFLRSLIDNPQLSFDKTAYPMQPGYLEFLKVQDALLRTYNSPK
ncbi:MAG: sulfotransferase [Candidatus Poribacteria bacterium]|nr:sulfotransferase [Candidatus Poribacteria bacterium]